MQHIIHQVCSVQWRTTLFHHFILIIFKGSILHTGFIAIKGTIAEWCWIQNPLKANEWIGHLYIKQPNIRLIKQVSKQFTINWRFTSNKLPYWEEQSQDLMLRSIVSFLVVTYSGNFTYLLIIFQVEFFLTHFYFSSFTLCECWLSVCNRPSLNTNYTELSLLECYDLLILTRSNVCVAKIAQVL